jgi:hypothetical protein
MSSTPAWISSRWPRAPGSRRQDAALVGESHRAARLTEAGGGDTRDLWGDVGAQRDHLAGGRLDEAQGGRVAQGARQHRGVFEGRRDDAVVSPALELAISASAMARRRAAAGGRKSLTPTGRRMGSSGIIR